MTNPSSQDSFVAVMSFVCGMATGAALALIFAPASGRETRSYLQKGGRRLADDVSNRGRELWKDQRDNIASVVEQGREKATEFGNQINQAIDQGKAAYRESKERSRAASGDVS